VTQKDVCENVRKFRNLVLRSDVLGKNSPPLLTVVYVGPCLFEVINEKVSAVLQYSTANAMHEKEVRIVVQSINSRVQYKYFRLDRRDSKWKPFIHISCVAVRIKNHGSTSTVWSMLSYVAMGNSRNVLLCPRPNGGGGG
jgi:hypothetical protein